MLSRLFEFVAAFLRALTARKNVDLGKELAHGEMHRKHARKLEKAVLARRSIRNLLRDPDRLHEDDGQRRD